MFKKPICPYCGAIYFYKDIKNQKNNSTQICHNCKKNFTVKKTRGRVFLLLMTFVLTVGINIFMLAVIGVKSVLPMFITTLIIMALAYIIQPYFVKFAKENKKEKRH